MRHILPFLAALGIPDSRRPLQARIPHTAGVSAASVAAAASAASAAQSTADSAASAASAAQSNATGAISALLTGPGVPLKFGPALVADDGGAPVNVSMAYPGFWPTYTTGQRLGIKGVITARKTDGTLLQSKDVDVILLVDATDPDAITFTAESNSHALRQANHADFGDYFGDDEDVADFDTAAVAVTGAPRLVTSPLQDFRLEADLVVRDLGSPVPA